MSGHRLLFAIPVVLSSAWLAASLITGKNLSPRGGKPFIIDRRQDPRGYWRMIAITAVALIINGCALVGLLPT